VLLVGPAELLEHPMEYISFEYAKALRCVLENYIEREAYWREMCGFLYEKCMDLEERCEDTMTLNFQLENSIAENVKTIRRKDDLIALSEEQIERLEARLASEALMAIAQQAREESDPVEVNTAS